MLDITLTSAICFVAFFRKYFHSIYFNTNIELGGLGVRFEFQALVPSGFIFANTGSNLKARVTIELKG